jgi:membrane fusion protein
MAGSPYATDPDAEVPFLSTEPPPLVARGLAMLLIAMFVTAIVAAILVRVPETVIGRFVLVPVRGTDPVRAFRQGQVTAVRAAEGDAVVRGAPLFVVRSEPAADRSAELWTLRAQLRGADAELRNARRGHEERRRADAQQEEILRARHAALDRTIALKATQHRLAADLVERFRGGADGGVISSDEFTRRQLEATRLAEELAALEGERAQVEAESRKLRHEMAAREADFRDTMRRLVQEQAQAEIRAAALSPNAVADSGADLIVAAPCTGTVLRLRTRSAGAVVQEGDFLGEMACSGERLQAELMLPHSGVARVREGQAVKLLYDAFPYQRFGVRAGRVRWVSPAAGVADGNAVAADAAFRALIDLRDSTISVNRRPQALLPGMGGTARVVVERRALISYAFEPIRQLRENFAGGTE